MGSLLVHVFTPITHTFPPYSWFSVFLSFSYSFFSVFFLFRIVVAIFYYARLWPFYIACHDRIYHFYHLTTFGMS